MNADRAQQFIDHLNRFFAPPEVKEDDTAKGNPDVEPKGHEGGIRVVMDRAGDYYREYRDGRFVEEFGRSTLHVLDENKKVLASFARWEYVEKM